MQRRCSMDSCQVGFVALSMRVLNTTPGFQDSSNPHESSRTPSDPGAKAGSDVLDDSAAEVDVGGVAAPEVGAETVVAGVSGVRKEYGEGVPVSNAGTMRGATDFG